MQKHLREDWEIFYDRDMEQMGNIFELAYREGYCMHCFISKFMKSEVRVAMDNWHPDLSNGPAGDVIDIFIRDFGPIHKNTVLYPDNCMRWIGEMYVYLTYYTSIRSAELYDLLPLSKMLENYNIGHEMGFEQFAQKICEHSND